MGSLLQTCVCGAQTPALCSTTTPPRTTSSPGVCTWCRVRRDTLKPPGMQHSTACNQPAFTVDVLFFILLSCTGTIVYKQIFWKMKMKPLMSWLYFSFSWQCKPSAAARSTPAPPAPWAVWLMRSPRCPRTPTTTCPSTATASWPPPSVTIHIQRPQTPSSTTHGAVGCVSEAASEPRLCFVCFFQDTSMLRLWRCSRGPHQWPLSRPPSPPSPLTPPPPGSVTSTRSHTQVNTRAAWLKLLYFLISEVFVATWVK